RRRRGRRSRLGHRRRVVRGVDRGLHPDGIGAPPPIRPRLRGFVVNTVELTKVGKRYVKYDDVPMLLSRALSLRARTRRSHLWALRDLDLAVGGGESIGVIGRNGSGKSTLLRLVAGVTAPTEGRVAVVGRLAPLISVGVGFHQELTGRENVYVNATVLGLTRPEIDRRLDEIVAFAEIGDLLDTPVKFYSS